MDADGDWAIIFGPKKCTRPSHQTQRVRGRPAGHSSQKLPEAIAIDGWVAGRLIIIIIIIIIIRVTDSN